MPTIALSGARRSRTGVMSRLFKALAVRRSRLALTGLSDAALRDIGLTRAEAEAEARRPIWDAPSWRHG